MGGMAMTSYAQVTETIAITKTMGDDDKDKKAKDAKTKKNCDAKKSCCKHDFDKKSCNDKKMSKKDEKKDGSKHK
ncbi:MAG: hypothetical protein C0598_01700 [Marinilabiliales bacterium]|nr:MAG: hypothetical protein C0598_01700 [Marinilabiliales bacterium]